MNSASGIHWAIEGSLIVGIVRHRHLGVAVIAVCLLFASVFFWKESPVEMRFTLRSPESAADVRGRYTQQLLLLALEKTRPEFGDYAVSFTPPMNTARAIAALKKHHYDNFIAKLSYDPLLEQAGLTRGQTDIDLDITGYRVCFTRKALLPELAKITSLESLRRFTHGQGQGWADVQILKANGFTVRENSEYENLFKMAAAGSVDLFCRGVTEVADEMRAHGDIPDLVIEPELLLYYPLPRYLYVNNMDKTALRRIEKGIDLARQDGSWMRLWLENYADSLELVNIAHRRRLVLENPLLQGLAQTNQRTPAIPVLSLFGVEPVPSMSESIE